MRGWSAKSRLAWEKSSIMRGPDANAVSASFAGALVIATGVQWELAGTELNKVTAGQTGEKTAGKKEKGEGGKWRF